MILILSQDVFEFTTEQVMDWIEQLGGDCVRLNGEDLTRGEPFALGFGTEAESVEFLIGGRRFTAADVGVVWNRRWHTLRDFDYLDSNDNAALGRRIRDHLIREFRSVTRGLFVLLRHAAWLTRPHEPRLRKPEMLSRAVEAGLEIPATLITNNKDQLRSFRARCGGRIIAKPASQCVNYVIRNKAFTMYTADVTDEALERAPDRFFPALVQELVEKEMEVRTFYLDGQCSSMAIFSQADSKTQVDFRRYNYQTPNRFVPYVLPDDVAEKVCALMSSLELTTGSIDLIRTPDGRHVFLEINPIGQFGMVSRPCCYGLEKKVAEHLIALDNRHGKTAG